MRRREFIGGLGSALAARPFGARAQQSGLARRVGLMINHPESEPEALRRIGMFERTLEGLGWTGTRRLQIDKRWDVYTLANGQAAVAELLKLSPEVIVAGIGQALIAAKAATQTIPIVFIAVSEPVSRGFVQSLAHPGGNITGFTNIEPKVGSKWLQLLKEMATGVVRVALVFNPDSQAAVPFSRAVEASADKFGVEVFTFPVHAPMEIASAIETISQQPGGGLISLPDGYSARYCDVFIELTARHRLPAIYPARFFTDCGGLVSYAVDFVEEYRQAAHYVDRILRGEKPSDLPVQQPTKFELVINRKTAKLLGIEVPATLLAMADEVME